MFRLMGIGTDGDHLAAKFQITGQNIGLRVWLAEAVFVAGGIDFQGQIIVDDGL